MFGGAIISHMLSQTREETDQARILLSVTVSQMDWETHVHCTKNQNIKMIVLYICSLTMITK